MFDRYISLGFDCEPTAQLRRLTGVTQAQILDWQVIPHKALIGVLATDFDGYFELDNLVLSEDRRIVLDTATGVESHHLFPPDLDGRVQPRRIARDYPMVRSRQEYLLRRWRETVASDQAVLYVRRDPHDEFTAEDIVELRDALCGSYPRHRFAVVWVRGALPGADESAEVHRIGDGLYETHMAVRLPRADHWRGDDSAWDRLFPALQALEPLIR